ncbi:MAG: peptidoglycan DD-metalloendopeptidase family protein [Alphaproteobacteria bacterium]|nr:peptidoglycan DD-metalloendopeptidase family protein [Alphaproteobacteria bacterium]
MTSTNDPSNNDKTRWHVDLGRRIGSPGWFLQATALVALIGVTIGLGVYVNFASSDIRNAAGDEEVPTPFSVIASLGPSGHSGEAGRSLTAPLDDSALLQPADDDDASVKQEKVMRGDTLTSVLIRAGVALADAHNAISALSEHFNMRRIREGQEIELTFDPEGDSDEPTLQAVRLQPDVERAVTVARQDDGSFASSVVPVRLDEAPTHAGGRISDSLYMAMEHAGVPANLISEFIRIYSWDVDFQREIQEGDSFEIYFDRYEDADGHTVKTGPLLFASLTLSGKRHALYYYQPKDGGDADYFDANGHSARKALLLTPIDGARLTSGFGMRHHPILGYTKMHKGLDFGAGRGTPIHAAGDGVVEKAFHFGTYGNYVRIRHNGTYETAYAHMQGFAKGIHPGVHVHQGQVIGYVGTTGRSTGPHLHYEVLKSGTQVNPRGLKLPTGRQLDGQQLVAFRKSVEDLDTQIAALPMSTTIASSE